MKVYNENSTILISTNSMMMTSAFVSHVKKLRISLYKFQDFVRRQLPLSSCDHCTRGPVSICTSLLAKLSVVVLLSNHCTRGTNASCTCIDLSRLTPQFKVTSFQSINTFKGVITVYSSVILLVLFMNTFNIQISREQLLVQIQGCCAPESQKSTSC